MVVVDMYFNMHKVRFNKMDELFERHISSTSVNIDSGDTKVNVFINLESILRRLTRPDVVDMIKVSENKEFSLVSNILNLVAHYRLYFKSKRMKNDVYIYTGHPFDTTFSNSEVLTDYRKNYREKFTLDSYGKVIGRTMTDMMDILEIIVRHIGGVYVLKSDTIEPSLLPYSVMKLSGLEDDLNVMITTDRYDYQYTMYDFLILRPKHKSDYMISKSNVLEIMALEDKVELRNPNDISVDYLPLILSFLGSQTRNIPKISGIGLSRMLNIINRGIDEGLLNNTTASFYSFEKVLKDEVKETILNNYLCIDLETQYRQVEFSKVHEVELQNAIVDNYNNVELRELSERYFEPTNNPIMLSELLPEIKKPKMKLFDDRRRPD